MDSKNVLDEFGGHCLSLETGNGFQALSLDVVLDFVQKDLLRPVDRLEEPGITEK